MATHTEEVKIKFSAETNRQSFQQLQKELDKIQESYVQHMNPQKNPLANEFKEAAVQAEKLSSAMAASYNSKLNTYNLDTLNSKLKESGTSLSNVVNKFNQIGGSGQNALLSLTSALPNVNLQLNTTKTIFDKIGEGLLKTFSWSIYSSVINNLSSGIQQAYGYVKALDSSLNDIRIVTGKSADEMDRFAELANKSAITLGKGTKDYTNAALIYYQQGLNDAEVQARTDVTLKTASVTQQDTAAVSEQLTAIWNGYKVSAEEAELYIDKVAAVAATTAADLEELSTGMSKVASAANLLGVDVDQMNAMLATTVSVTRQSAESVGVAYKTIFARMSSIQAGETVEDGATLTSYTKKMANLGFSVLDANGKLRDMGDVVEEIGNKWQDMSREQQIALAQVMAGTRQYNNLTALFDNWDMYKDALQTSAEAAGTLNEQQSIYMESTAAHIQQLSTAAEGVYDSLLDAETINTISDAFTNVLQTTEKVVNNLGGLKGILETVGPIFLSIFNKQVSDTILSMANNILIPFQNQKKITEALNQAKQLQQIFQGLKGTESGKILTQRIQTLGAGKAGLLSASDVQNLNAQLNSLVEAEKLVHNEQDNLEISTNRLNTNLKETGLSAIDLSEKEKTLALQFEETEININATIETLSSLKNQKPDDIDISGLTDVSDETKNKLLEYIDQVEKGTLTQREFKKVLKDWILILQQSREQLDSTKNSYNNLTSAQQRQLQLIREIDNTTRQLNTKATLAEVTTTFGVVAQGTNLLERFNKTLKDTDLTPLQKFGLLTPQITAFVRSFSRVPAIANTFASFKDLGKLKSLQGDLSRIRNETLLLGREHNRLSAEINIYESHRSQLSGKTLEHYEALKQQRQGVQKEISKLGEESDRINSSTASIKSNLASSLLALGAMVVAAVALVALAKKLNEIWTARQEELDSINQALETEKNHYNEISNSLKSLNSAIDDFSEKQKALRKAKDGTVEWRKALEDVQSTVESLIQQYPSLAKYAEWENGGYTLSEENLKKFEKELEAQRNASVVSQTALNISQLRAENDLALQSLQTQNGVIGTVANKDFFINWSRGYQELTDNLATKVTADSVVGKAGVDIGLAALTGPFSLAIQAASKDLAELENQADINYKNSLLSIEEIQEKIKEAREENGEFDVQYWETLLQNRQREEEILKQQKILAEQIFDLYSSDEIKDFLGVSSDEPLTETQELQYNYLKSSMTDAAARITSPEAQSQYINAFQKWIDGDEAELSSFMEKELLQSVASAHGLTEADIKNLTLAPIMDGGKAVGVAVRYLGEDLQTYSAEAAAAAALTQKEKNLVNDALESLKNGTGRWTEALQDNYQMLSEQLTKNKDAWMDYSRSFIEATYKQGKAEGKDTSQLKEAMTSFDNLSQQALGGDEMQALYEEMSQDLSYTDSVKFLENFNKLLQTEGKESVEQFHNLWKNNKVEISEMVDFSINKEEYDAIFQEFEGRFKKLSIEPEEVDIKITRQATKLGYEEEDIDLEDSNFVDMILRSLESEPLLEKIGGIEDFFETLETKTYSKTNFTDYLGQLQEAISTVAGYQIDDTFILENLETLKKYVNGVEGSEEELAKLLQGNNSFKKSSQTFFYQRSPSEAGRSTTFTTYESERAQNAGALSLARWEITRTLGIDYSDKEWENLINDESRETKLQKVLERAGYTKHESEGGRASYHKTIPLIEDATLEYTPISGIEGPAELTDVSEAEINNGLAKALGYENLDEMLANDWNWVDEEQTILRRTLTAEQEIELLVSKVTDKVATNTVINTSALGLTDKSDQGVADYLGISVQELKDLYTKETYPGTTVYRLKSEIEHEIEEKGVNIPAATGANGNDGTKPPDPWETQKSDYNYSDQIINSKKKELADLQEETEYLSGDVLLENYEKQKKVLEEINQELEKRNQKLREENTETQGDLQKLADKYGVKLAYDEDGRLTQDSYEAFYDAANKAGEAATTTEAQNQVKADISAFTSGTNTINSNIAEIDDNLESVDDNLDEIKQLDITKQFADSNQAITKATRNTDLWKNQIKELSEDFDSLSPEEQIENLEARERLKSDIVTGAQEALEEVKNDINEWIGDNNIKLPTGIDFSNLENMSPTELQELENKIQEALDSEEWSVEQKKQLEPILGYLEKAEPLVQDIEDYTEKTVSHTKEIKEATNQMRLDEIEQETSKINKELEKTKEAQSDLSGAALIANLQKQQSLQRQLVEQEKKKSAELLRQRQAQENTLRDLKGFEQLGVEIQYNTDGTLANYYEIQKAIYENADLNEEVKQILLEQLDILNSQAKAYSDQNEAVEKSKKAVKDLAKEIKKQIFETALKDFNAKIDVELNIEDAWRNLHKLRTELEGLKKNDYLKNVNMQLKQLQEYLRTNPNSTLAGGSIQQLSDHVSKIMSEIRKMQSGAESSIYGKDQAQAFQDLQNYRDQLGSTVDSALQSIEEVRQTYLDAIDDMISSNNKYMSSWDKINEILQNAADIMSLTYGDKAYDRMKKYLEEEQKNNLALANTARSLANDYEERYRKATSDEERMKYADAWQEAMSKVFSYQKAAIENAQKLFDEAMKNMKSLGDDIWSEIFTDSSAIPIGMRWDLEKEKAKDYLDYTQSIYERDALQRKLAESISNANTVSAANKLREIQTEILDRLNAQIDATKTLTQFEVDRANALYELTLRQIALEEARDNKTKMRLRRDKAGNYRYEYVADDNDIADKQQAVDDAMMDLYNMTKDAGIETSDYLRSLREEFYNKVEELYKDDALEPDQISAAIAELTKTYNEKWNERVQELYKIYNDLLGLSKGENEGFEGTLRDILHLTDIERGMFTTPLEEIQQRAIELRNLSTATADTTAEQTPADVEFATDIKEWEIEQARQMALQVDSIANLLPYLESMADNIKGLSATALQIYEQALLLREQLGKSDSDSSKNTLDDGSSGDGTFYYITDKAGNVYVDPEYRHLLENSGITTLAGKRLEDEVNWVSHKYDPAAGEKRRHYTIDEALRTGIATDEILEEKTAIEKLFETAMNAKLLKDIWTWAEEQNIKLDSEKFGRDKEYTQQVKEQYEKWRDEEQEVNMTFNLPNVTNYTEVLKALMEFGSKGLYVAQQKKKKASSVTK